VFTMTAIGSLLITFWLAQAPVANQFGQISGYVTTTGSATPLSGVRVTLVPTSPSASPFTRPSQTITDQQGFYLFDRVAAGGYFITLTKSGFAPPQDSYTDPSAMFQLAAGQHLDRVNRVLQRGGTIAGRVLDPKGTPLADAHVTVMQRLALPGLPRVPGQPAPLYPAPGEMQPTNDLGEFRASGLAAGEYVVAARQERTMMVGATASPPPQRGQPIIALTFYPGTTDSLAARSITVNEGAEVGNIEFVLQTTPAFRVSGTVVDEDGKPVAGALVRLNGDSKQDVKFMDPDDIATTRADGQFDIYDVPPGTYQARAAIPITIGDTTSASWDTADSDGASRSRALSAGLAVSVSDGAGGGSFTSSSGPSPMTTNPPSEVLVGDADVTNLRVVARRKTRR
jgi:hypothetical protein